VGSVGSVGSVGILPTFSACGEGRSWPGRSCHRSSIFYLLSSAAPGGWRWPVTT